MTSFHHAKQPALPCDCCPLRHQVAGHVYGRSKSKMGILERANTNEILKPVDATPIGVKELSFYEELEVLKQKDNLPTLRGLLQFIAPYYGLFEFDGVRYLRLENVCATYQHPNVIDIKIGKQTWDPYADEAQIARKRLKYPPCEQLGFQVNGFQRHFLFPSAKRSHYMFCQVKHDKRCLRKLMADEMIHAMASFFANTYCESKDVQIRLNLDLIKMVIDQLESLYYVMRKQRMYLFYATSLLIVCESTCVGRQTNRSAATRAAKSTCSSMTGRQSDEPQVITNGYDGERHAIVLKIS